LKREYGKDLVFMGGIDTQNLPFIKPDEVRAMTKETMEILGKGGGYIIAPSQELMSDVPLENIVALVQTVREYRDKVM
jgi:uroporphyrinogen decarboxylase